MQSGLSFYQRCYSREHLSHRHEYSQLVLPLQGSLEMDIDQRGGRVQAGTTLAIVGAGQQHAFAASGDNHFLVCDLAAPQLQQQLESLPDFVPIHSGLNSLLAGFKASSIRTELAPGQQWQLAQRLVSMLPGQSGSTDAASHRQRVEWVRATLDQQYAAPLNVGQLAASVHWSVRQLSGQFRSQMGMSLRDYHGQVRLFHARRLLQHSDLSIQQVADRLGYSDQTSLTHRFRQQHGLSPRSWRQQMREQNTEDVVDGANVPNPTGF